MTKKKDEEFGRSPDAYSPPSFRGVLIVFVTAAVGIALVWWAFSIAAEGR